MQSLELWELASYSINGTGRRVDGVLNESCLNTCVDAACVPSTRDSWLVSLTSILQAEMVNAYQWPSARSVDR